MYAISTGVHLIFFILSSRECHVNRLRFLSCSWKSKGKKTEITYKGGCCKCLRLFWGSQQASMESRSLKWTSDVTRVSCTSIKRLRKEKVDTGGAAFQLQQRNTNSPNACSWSWSHQTKNHKILYLIIILMRLLFQ